MTGKYYSAVFIKAMPVGRAQYIKLFKAYIHSVVSCMHSLLESPVNVNSPVPCPLLFLYP